MVRLNTLSAGSRRSGPLRTEQLPSGKTHEGGTGYARDERTELFLRATTNFAGEDLFYEKGSTSDNRICGLVRQLAVSEAGWPWVKGFLPWLRSDGNIRTASIMLAIEAVHARLAKGLHGDGNRQLIASVLQRPDEPGEAVAYYLGKYHSKTLPKPIKRGIADAVSKLNERGFLRYDSESRGIRIGDVLELTHPKGRFRGTDGGRSWQDELFRYAITARHNRDGEAGEPPRKLSAVHSRRTLSQLPPEARHEFARNALRIGAAAKQLEIAAAGQWEWILSWLGDAPEDAALLKKEQWELILPHMGYMALIRNLRNLDQAGISDSLASKLTARIADPEEVKRSRQLPFRFLSAYLEAPSLRWGQALETALTLSTQNVPELGGRTLILIDTSGSMQSTLSSKSKMTRVKAAALFALALGLKNPLSVDVYGFADGNFKVDGIGPGVSLLKAVEMFDSCVGRVGHGTQIEHNVRATFSKKHSRVCVFSDMQTFASSPGFYGYYGVGDISSAVPASVPVYGFNLAGYTHGAMPVTGSNNRHEMGGLTDHTFSLIKAIEMGQNGVWPWESQEAHTA